MDLSINDRLALLHVLPKEGDVISIRIVRNLREELSFSEEEFKEFGITIADGKINISKPSDKTKDISIGERANEIIVNSLNELNRAKKLTEGHLQIWEMFMEGTDGK